jgi:putative CocE/NonD family hydrolase
LASAIWATHGSTTTLSPLAGSTISSKGEENGILTKTPKVQYYTMGMNKWQSSDTWPPAAAKPVTLLSGKQRPHANSLNGDGALVTAPEQKDAADKFAYDPMNPVPTRGGGFCCMGADYKPGAIDQRSEVRDDILVYSTGPLTEGWEVSGPIDVTLYVSSDAKDTDFTIKLIEVLPDGTAYNIDENIQRVRYREGYDKPPVFMEKDKVYKIAFQPMQTSIYFAPGHQIRIEVSSSNFPRFDRNLNTGGDNVSESEGVVAHNAIHHSAQYPSTVTLSVVKK